MSRPNVDVGVGAAMAAMLLLSSLVACDRTPPAEATNPADPPAETAPTPDTPPPANATQADPGFAMLDTTVLAATDTLATLRTRHGETSVTETKVPGAEGEEFDGWLLFPDDATRRVYVYLDDAGQPSTARLLDRESTWQRSDGIRMGLTLAELVQLNGAAVTFMGFDWDYGGGVTNWNDGKLQRDPPLGTVQLCPPETDATAEPGYPAGDSEFDSNNPWAVAHPPLVCGFSVDLAPHSAPETAP